MSLESSPLLKGNRKKPPPAINLNSDSTYSNSNQPENSTLENSKDHNHENSHSVSKTPNDKQAYNSFTQNYLLLGNSRSRQSFVTSSPILNSRSHQKSAPNIPSMASTTVNNNFTDLRADLRSPLLFTSPRHTFPVEANNLLQSSNRIGSTSSRKLINTAHLSQENFFSPINTNSFKSNKSETSPAKQLFHSNTLPPSPNRYSSLSEIKTDYGSIGTNINKKGLTINLYESSPIDDTTDKNTSFKKFSFNDVSNTKHSNCLPILEQDEQDTTNQKDSQNNINNLDSLFKHPTANSSFINGSGLHLPIPHRLTHSASIPEALDGRITQARTSWYDDFTTIDWLHDIIKESYRQYVIQHLTGFRGKLLRIYDASQGWILIFLISCAFALIAYIIDVIEPVLNDWKLGYCSKSIFANRSKCCNLSNVEDPISCSQWHTWSAVFNNSYIDNVVIDYILYITVGLILALISCAITLTSVTNSTSNSAEQVDNIVSLTPQEAYQKYISPLSENNLAMDLTHLTNSSADKELVYGAAGSGVAEVKTILSGFVIRRFLGTYTLISKSIALIFSVSSGLAVGKEGPYVHIASCMGNIACRLFPKFEYNDGKRREIISSAASAGLTLAFGSPIAGVLFSLEEVSYYFPHKILFRTFFCTICSALCLKFLNPYGTGSIVMFNVVYDDFEAWRIPELFIYALIGICGGIFGAAFIQLNYKWGNFIKSRSKIIRQHPSVEVALVAFLTLAACFWNPFTTSPASEILADLTSPCFSKTPSSSIGPSNSSLLCPNLPQLPHAIRQLLIAFVLKLVFTTITIGTKIPSGIYVPSMVLGALFGRLLGLTLQYLHHISPLFSSIFFSSCTKGGPLFCTTPGIYAMASAGAFMAGVTRMTVTLAVILFELTGSMELVLPFSISILVSWLVSNAIYPLSIYDLQLKVKRFPFLEPMSSPVYNMSTMDLLTDSNGGLTENQSQAQNPETCIINDTKYPAPLLYYPSINVSRTNYTSAIRLRKYLDYLRSIGESDMGIPIIGKKNVVVGLLPGPELHYSLDLIEWIEGRELNDSDFCLIYRPEGKASHEFSSEGGHDFNHVDEINNGKGNYLNNSSLIWNAVPDRSSSIASVLSNNNHFFPDYDHHSERFGGTGKDKDDGSVSSSSSIFQHRPSHGSINGYQSNDETLQLNKSKQSERNNSIKNNVGSRTLEDNKLVNSNNNNKSLLHEERRNSTDLTVDSNYNYNEGRSAWTENQFNYPYFNKSAVSSSPSLVYRYGNNHENNNNCGAYSCVDSICSATPRMNSEDSQRVLLASNFRNGIGLYNNTDDVEGNEYILQSDPRDLTKFVDRTPLCIDARSPLAIAFSFFSKLGLRAIVVTIEGQYYGMLSKKKFLELTEQQRDKL